ncbi:hypothetical protein DJ568_14815 [Mucilaginibacter hurinus]|uniref:Acyltransferase 3 domain-containing protein n=1 Tax=Mucilaginibacter hurinus TaxID=2201324 RepID=A0A367GM96_9SPHI|nr:acyltransferase [Mucilaginibacter hurinus]RCH54148.1 hypothetical protein DJ568_14815 [Mucilaginibacter hurinus]
MQTLDTVIIRGNNNFGLVRLITASLVIFNHSSALFPKGYHMPETGYLRLWVFFFLSGLFITSSYGNSKTQVSFIIMRMSRLWPALIVCTLLTVFVMGPLVTSLSLNEYFTSEVTWKYLVSNSIIFNIKYYLPGVFTTNYFKDVVNNPLWTIPMELKCYGIVFGLGFLGLFKSKVTMLTGYMVMIIYLFNTKMNFWEITSGSITLYMLFFAGSICYFFRKYIYIDYRIALCLIFLLTLTHFATIHQIVSMLILQFALIYTTLVLGASRIFKKVKLPGDYSYGVYIYGFIVQQTIAHYLPDISPLVSIVYTMPVVIILGGLSWHLIENPALKFGKKLARMNGDERSRWRKSLLSRS